MSKVIQTFATFVYWYGFVISSVVFMVKNFDLKRVQSGVVDLRKGRSAQSKPSAVPPRDVVQKGPVSQATSRQSEVSSFLHSGAGDYSRLKPSPKSKRKSSLTLLIVLLFLLSVAALASFLIFYQAGISSESVKLSLATPKAIASGEQLTLQLIYENIDKVPIEQIEIILEYPEGFFFDRANLKPLGSKNNIWRLPDLQPGQSGKIEVAGQLIGQQKEDKEFKATFYYQPANFNSTFKTELATKVKISDVLFEVDLEAPAELQKGSDAQFKVTYKNTTALAMKDLEMSFELGDDFTILEASPSTTAELWWAFEKIEAQSQGQISLTGLFPKDLVGEAPWQFKVWLNTLKEGEKQQRLLYQKEGVVKIVAPEIKVCLEFTNKGGLSWGGNLDCQVIIENSGQAKAENAQLTVNFNSPVIDWNKFTSQQGAEKKGNSLIWTKTGGGFGEKLKELSPQAREKLTFSLPLKSEPEDFDLLNPEELIIEAQASLSFDFAGQTVTVTSQPQTAFLALEPQLITEARYYLDAQTAVGSGPLPPVIGQETRYRIYWKVFSGSNGLTQVEIKTSLPPYINWAGIADEATLGTPLIYDEMTRQVIWQLDSFSVNSQVMASFEVTVTPIDSQVNQLLILTNPTSFTAQEQQTKALISKTTNLLTSDLVGDPVAQGQGRVKVNTATTD